MKEFIYFLFSYRLVVASLVSPWIGHCVGSRVRYRGTLYYPKDEREEVGKHNIIGTAVVLAVLRT